MRGQVTVAATVVTSSAMSAGSFAKWASEGAVARSLKRMFPALPFVREILLGRERALRLVRQKMPIYKKFGGFPILEVGYGPPCGMPVKTSASGAIQRNPR